MNHNTFVFNCSNSDVTTIAYSGIKFYKLRLFCVRLNKLSKTRVVSMGPPLSTEDPLADRCACAFALFCGCAFVQDGFVFDGTAAEVGEDLNRVH